MHVCIFVYVQFWTNLDKRDGTGETYYKKHEVVVWDETNIPRKTKYSWLYGYTCEFYEPDWFLHRTVAGDVIVDDIIKFAYTREC